MSRRRIPDDAHKLMGTYRADRHAIAPATAANVDTGIDRQYPAMPEYVEARPTAVAVWRRIENLMKGTGLYNASHVDVLGRYCILQSIFEIDPTVFPAAQLTQLRMHARDLYLCPESQSKLGLTGSTKANAPANPFDELRQRMGAPN